MPLYEFYCDKCAKEVSVTMTISEREKGQPTCPHCGGRELRPLMGTFFTQTSKKS
jgi:putative FmdB family regulatory protein